MVTQLVKEVTCLHGSDTPPW